MARQYTAELKLAQEQGATVVCSWQPFEGRKMEYAPRHKGDPQPWVVTGTWDAEWRYSGRDCHAVKDGKEYTPVKPVRAMTEDQKYVLRALAERNGGVWYPGCGWHWANRSTTLRILNGLVKRGYAEVKSPARNNERIEITEAGRQEYKRIFNPVFFELEKKTAELLAWMKETEPVRIDGHTMWTWHDFRIILDEPREDGSVRFSVSTLGVLMPLVLKTVESWETAMERAATSVIARVLRRANRTSA